jgi:hypothetical protein
MHHGVQLLSIFSSRINVIAIDQPQLKGMVRFYL